MAIDNDDGECLSENGLDVCFVCLVTYLVVTRSRLPTRWDTRRPAPLPLPPLSRARPVDKEDRRPRDRPRQRLAIDRTSLVGTGGHRIGSP